MNIITDIKHAVPDERIGIFIKKNDSYLKIIKYICISNLLYSYVQNTVFKAKTPIIKPTKLSKNGKNKR